MPSTPPRLSRLRDLFDLDPQWSRVLAKPVIPKLFKRAHPGVQIRLFKLLSSTTDLRLRPVLNDLRKLAHDSRQVHAILKRQLSDGSWGTGEPGKAPSRNRQLLLLAHVQTLRALADLGGTRKWHEVKRALKVLLDYQDAEGRFPLPYHHQAAIGALMLDLGLIRNPAVHRLAHWLAERQRTDGGWMHVQVRTGADKGKSCIWTTAEVLNFLSRYPTMRIKEFLKPAGEFLLANALHPNHTTLLPDAHNWNILATGHRDVQLFQGGTLKVLAGLSQAGFNPGNPQFKKLYTWLLEQQLTNGLFPAAAGQDQRGDEWVTVKVLEVVKTVESSRPDR
ncbi:MAG: terpene cyclase/mutase family protein [Candidatus Marinimicrobia bacterium]|nr:terpene cyclase/mutase family protein [Candidatus Neomarinimicrobiota bacterium]